MGPQHQPQPHLAAGLGLEPGQGAAGWCSPRGVDGHFLCQCGPSSSCRSLSRCPGGPALLLDGAALRCFQAAPVLAGLLVALPASEVVHCASGWPGNRALHFLLPCRGSSALRGFCKCANGVHQLFSVFPEPKGDPILSVIKLQRLIKTSCSCFGRNHVLLVISGQLTALISILIFFFHVKVRQESNSRT